ncbi:hypothetical protein [uncultured Streptomyces sp.]|uniref:hypothetical protein n=1 Tax=uncultured Streptomyces sp. TaxID=174707 RepID=UPI0026254FE5|nr:hypothetical protein [uncultured Streptomyces sp.]
MSDDERRIRARLRHFIDGPTAIEEQPPLVQVHVVPESPAAAGPEDDDQDDEQREQDRPWWHVPGGTYSGRRAPDPAPPTHDPTAPGVHVTVNQPLPPWAQPPVDNRAAERLHRRRLAITYYLGAAVAGWCFGLPQQMAELLAQAGTASTPVGVALALVAYVIASYLPGLPYIPPALRPVIRWAACIPVSSAVLALALHAPGI